MTEDDWTFETKAIHAGQEPDVTTGAMSVPIFQTSTYRQNRVGEYPFSDYGRVDNPTRSALQTSLATLEGARYGLAFASGLAAEDVLMRHLLDPGETVMMSNDAYGGTYRLLARVLSKHGLQVNTAALRNPDALREAWTDATKLVWVETPSNPLLNIVDIEAVASIAHALGGLCVVDNTFATPYLQQPLALGADIVVHSTTKYIGGHSDAIGGFVALNDSDMYDELKFLQYAIGAVPGPMDCYLLLRGIKTLPVRMDRHAENAQAVAEMLSHHPAVGRVLYPGLPDHPNHDVAARQMRNFGGMISFTVTGGPDAATAVAQGTQLFTLAESLGAVESLVEHPAKMTHSSVANSPLEVDPSLIRLSVGLEGVDDLVGDLKGTLDRLT